VDASATTSCANALSGQRKFFAAVNGRRPSDATLFDDLQTTLYELDARIGLLDRSCAGQPEHAERALDAAAKERLERGCLAFAGSPSRCEPDIAW
jgi:hypothetical protein